MAGVIERNGAWTAIMRTLDGREVRKSTRIRVLPKVLKPGESSRAAKTRTRSEAQLVAAQMEKNLNGEQVNSQLVESLVGDKSRSLLGETACSQTVKAFLNSWLQSRAGHVGALSRDGKAVKQFLDFLKQDNLLMSKVTVHHARSFMERELERVSSGTVKRYLESLTCAFTRAVDARIIPSNPFRGIRPSARERNDRQERAALSTDEVKQLLEILPGEWPDMIRVCLYTGGQRLGDVAKMSWEQIDMDKAILRMKAKKSQKHMTKPIIAPLHQLFQRRQKEAVNKFVFPIAAMKHAQGNDTSSKLSLEFTDFLLEHGFIRQREKLAGDRRQLAEKSFHSLRATAVTVLRLAGVSADLCRLIVGHDSEEIERVYMRPQQSDISNAMNVIVDSIEGTVS